MHPRTNMLIAATRPLNADEALVSQREQDARRRLVSTTPGNRRARHSHKHHATALSQGENLDLAQVDPYVMGYRAALTNQPRHRLPQPGNAKLARSKEGDRLWFAGYDQAVKDLIAGTTIHLDGTLERPKYHPRHLPTHPMFSPRKDTRDSHG